MKVKVKDYAKALVDVKKFDAKHFLRILQKNSDMKKAKQIIALTEQLLLKKSGNKKITLQTAREIKKMSTRFAKKGDVVEKEVKPELVAGVKIIIDGERQLDFSLKNKLEKIFNV